VENSRVLKVVWSRLTNGQRSGRLVDCASSVRAGTSTEFTLPLRANTFTLPTQSAILLTGDSHSVSLTLQLGLARHREVRAANRCTNTPTTTAIKLTSYKTRAVLSPKNRAKPCKFRYVKPVGTSYRRYSDRRIKLALPTSALAFDTTSPANPDELA